MSNREKCISIIDSFSENQLYNIAVMLEAARKAVYEAEDDAYCLSLYKDYRNNPDNEEPMDIESFAAELGIAL